MERFDLAIFPHLAVEQEALLTFSPNVGIAFGKAAAKGAACIQRAFCSDIEQMSWPCSLVDVQNAKDRRLHAAFSIC